MPVTHWVREDGVLVTEASGLVTEPELATHLRAHVEDDALGPGMRELVDLSGVLGVDLRRASIERLLDFEEAHLHVFANARLAIVAPDDLPYGLARMYELLRLETSAEIRVFRERGRAEDWLSSGSPTA